MIKIGGKLPAKFAIKFALFFIVIAALAYFYFTNSFENEAIEKFRYKAEVFSNYLEQNPHIFWMKKQIDDRDQIIKLMELNDAVYLVLEDKEGSVFDAFNIKEAENNFYITTRNNEGISQDHKIFRISLPIVANRMNVGKIYVGFYAFDIITNLYKKELLTALLSLSILLLGIIISFYLASISFKPLTKISSTLDQRIKGGKNVKIDYREKDEFGLLAEKINSVMNELDISSDRVESLNRKLKNVFRDKIHEMEFEINQKQIALASLRTSEEQFRLLFENAPIGMVIVLPDMKIKSANKSFCNTLGYELDELIGLRLEILFSRRRVGDSIWENYEPDEKLMNLCSKQVLMKKDNSIIRVIAKYDVAHDNYNQPKHYIIQVSDITELLRVQNELEIALEKANESSRLKDAFLAQMSHEIRTPLNVILNSVPILADEVGEKDEDKSFECRKYQAWQPKCGQTYGQKSNQKSGIN
jgi:PAS domain S-box-containing protein